MYTSAALLDIHDRSHQSLIKLLAHCRQFSIDEINRKLPGFGYPTIRLQLHHQIGGEKYWLGVLQGRIEADDDDYKYPTLESLEKLREEIYNATTIYLNTVSPEELNTARKMMTWGNNERILIPANVIMRTQTHLYQHQGQILAMCRLLGKPAEFLDYPIT
jgi:uncharacterized damage-inducible protein DinB